MDWGKVGKGLMDAVPIIGGLLTNPLGTIADQAGKLLADKLGCEATPPAVHAAIAADPNALVKLKEIESNERTELARINLEATQAEIKAGSKDMATVNTTMQEETKSDKWWVSGWRPFNGFMFGITMFLVYFFLPLVFGLIETFAESKPDLEVPEIEYFVWLAWASVLGVASWHRGMKQRLESGEVGKPGIMGAIANQIKR